MYTFTTMGLPDNNKSFILLDNPESPYVQYKAGQIIEKRKNKIDLPSYHDSLVWQFNIYLRCI